MSINDPVRRDGRIQAATVESSWHARSRPSGTRHVPTEGGGAACNHRTTLCENTAMDAFRVSAGKRCMRQGCRQLFEQADEERREQMRPLTSPPGPAEVQRELELAGQMRIDQPFEETT